MSQEQKELCCFQTKVSTRLYFLWKDYACRCKFGSIKLFFWSSREGIMVNSVYHQLDWILNQGVDLQGYFCDGLKVKNRTLSKSGQTRYKEVWEKKIQQQQQQTEMFIFLSPLLFGEYNFCHHSLMSNPSFCRFPTWNEDQELSKIPPTFLFSLRLLRSMNWESILFSTFPACRWSSLDSPATNKS